MLLARSLGQQVLVSVSHPPAWALTAQGPDAETTADLVVSLAQKYPNLAAVELFPGANTAAGWGTTPNAAAYVAVFTAARARVQMEALGLQLVAAGLSNVITGPEDLRDVDFLQALYTAGLETEIVSLWLETLDGQPLDAPTAEHLRHYEELRAVMVANGHRAALLWITSLKIPASEQWIKAAYAQMYSQLYIGAVFYARVTNSLTSEPQNCCLEGLPYGKNGVANVANPDFSTLRVKLMARK
jgi:hypothetical protein